MKTLLLTLVLALAGPAIAQKSVGYRGAGLGDDIQAVRAAVTAAFEVVSEPDMLPAGDMQSVKAGNSVGIRRNGCPFAAMEAPRISCLLATYTMRMFEGRMPVTFIRVQHSFDEGVPFDGFMERIRLTYGDQKATYDGPIVGGIRTRYVLFGGVNVPRQGFRPSSYPYDDGLKIRGKYMLMTVVTSSTLVVGYELQISDADKAIRLAAESEARARAEAERMNQDSLKKLKF
jgi:hypothetical protein